MKRNVVSSRGQLHAMAIANFPSFAMSTPECHSSVVPEGAAGASVSGTDAQRSWVGVSPAAAL
ncbi:hypothetical protein QF025_006863 [Paraburkholderia graminis]|uniref:Uncharacterized protein n=1 Tax=Paraburkholderia graminis TaxID=60548 RepID=A0ABD5CS10_9BURK|nr:hypothetical protein [Paraburkholderia graminis]